MGTPLMMDNLILVGIAFLALLVIGLIFSRLYRRSSKERSFVRTGLGGQKVVMDGGALVLPVFHETILGQHEHAEARGDALRQGLACSPRTACASMSWPPSSCASCRPRKVSRTLRRRSASARMDPEQLSELVEDKFVDALRAAAVVDDDAGAARQAPGLHPGRAERRERGSAEERSGARERVADAHRSDRRWNSSIRTTRSTPKV